MNDEPKDRGRDEDLVADMKAQAAEELAARGDIVMRALDWANSMGTAREYADLLRALVSRLQAAEDVCKRAEFLGTPNTWPDTFIKRWRALVDADR